MFKRAEKCVNEKFREHNFVLYFICKMNWLKNNKKKISVSGYMVKSNLYRYRWSMKKKIVYQYKSMCIRVYSWVTNKKKREWASEIETKRITFIFFFMLVLNFIYCVWRRLNLLFAVTHTHSVSSILYIYI